ncbi:MAG: PhoH family protein [Victivallaceae bacterium]|nr:PhoH family protein [Victivallaceae bacterium]
MSGDTTRFYFPPGAGLADLCAGDELKKLRHAAEFFDVRAVSRDNWVEFSGEEKNRARAQAFFQTLAEFFRLRGGRPETPDFELLMRATGGEESVDLRELWKQRVKVGSRRREVLPRSRSQMRYLAAIREHDVVFGIGPAGTGKTYLAMAAAVEAFLAGKVRRIVLTRPARESGEKLGFLPGSLEEKVSPYLRPLYDALNDMLSPDETAELVGKNLIEVAPLAFMRGRSLNDAFIILDEAQNTTVEQMLVFLTGMGFNSRCVVTGDPSQSDLAPGEKSGLLHAVETLRALPEIGFVFFRTSDVVRHFLLEKIINAYTGKDKKYVPDLS